MASKKKDPFRWGSELEKELEEQASRLGIRIRVTAGEAFDAYKKGLTPKAAARWIIAKGKVG